MIVGWLLLLAFEGVVLFYGQRRLFWAVVNLSNSYLLAYFMAVPGTILHESSHYIVCLLLGVPAGDRVRMPDGSRGRVSFFFPKKGEDGSITLGSVPYAATDPLRGALIAVAPVVVVPLLFMGLTALLLGTVTPNELKGAFTAAALWKEVLWVYVAFSCGQAAFPSPGDHIGFIGGSMLIALVAGVAIWLLASNEGTQLGDVIHDFVIVLSVPAITAAISLVALGVMHPNKIYRRK